MQGSGGGALGALLILAPLAAIPVFAIVGIPQFAPVAASPSDDEDPLPEVHELRASEAARAAPPGASKRTADDLFAPLPQPGGRAPSPNPSVTREISLTSRTQPAAHWSPPPEALGDWQVSPEDREVPPAATGRAAIDLESAGARVAAGPKAPGERATAVRQIAAAEIAGSRDASGLIPIDDFDKDLLDPRATQPPNEPTVGDRGLSEPPRIDRASANPLAGAGVIERIPMDMSAAAPRSDWQIAARRLKELGIQQYRLEARIEEQRFIFRCAFPVGQSAAMKRLFEADADNPLDAVLQVLEQVDEWRAAAATIDRKSESVP